MHITESARNRITTTLTQVQKAGKVAWLIATGIVALIIITLVLATNYFASEQVFARSNGEKLANASELLEQAELVHNASLSTTDVEVLSPLGEEDTLCYLVLVGETLTDDIACGVVRFPENEVGGYDTTKVSFKADVDGAIIGSLPETVTWERHGSLPAGASLVRPDGKQPLSGDLLKRPVVQAQPLPETITETIYVDVERFVAGETITEYITEQVEVLVPTTEPVRVESASLLATVTDEQGQVFTAPSGENLLALTITGITSTSPAEWFIEVDGDRSPVELNKDGEAILRIPAGASVQLLSVLDEVEQMVTLSGEKAGAIDVPAELKPLYAEETKSQWSQNASRFNVRENTRAELSGQAFIRHEVWDAELGWGITKVAVSNLDNLCRADDQGRRIYSKSSASPAYDFSTTSLIVDGVELGAPQAMTDGEDGVYVLSWRTGDASSLKFNPTLTLNCEGTFWSSSEAFEPYSWVVPVDLSGSITSVLRGEETSETSTPSPSPSTSPSSDSKS